MKKFKINLDLIFNLLFPLLSSFVISMALPNFSTYYDSLNTLIKVPAVVFPIVWTILYVIMGYSGYKISSIADLKGEKLYYLQLLVNLMWTPLFFGLQNPLLGLIDILVLLVLIVLMMIHLHKTDKTLFYLWIPYLIWIVFATFLNASIFFLN